MRGVAPSSVNRLALWLKPRALYIDLGTTSSAVFGRAAVLLLLVALSWAWISQPLDGGSQIAPSFAHGIISMANTVFHEAGHIILSFLGRLVTSLAGSLFQVGIPLLCTAAFLTRHLDPFGASVTTWWAGVNFVELAPYINDASAQQLILLGGVTGRDVPGYHDWNYVLTKMGLLNYDHALAIVSHATGVVLILGSLGWGVMVLWLQFLENRSH